MPDIHQPPSTETSDAAQRLRVAMRLQEIESNPLSPEQVAMFERFEREGWSHERRREFILAHARQATAAA